MSNLKYNSEGYYDPTAYAGLRSVIQEENAYGNKD